MNTDAKPLTITALAAALGISRDRVYEAKKMGYALEFPALNRTSINHFLDWQRQQGDAIGSPSVESVSSVKSVRSVPESPCGSHPASQSLLEREQYRLRSASDKSRERSSTRGSRTASPRPKKPASKSRPAASEPLESLPGGARL